MLSRSRQRLTSLRGPKLTRLGPGTTLLTFGGRRPGVESVGEDAWLVERPRDGRRRFALRSLDESTWLLRLGGKRNRAVRRIGPPHLRTDLLVDERSARAHLRVQQLGLLEYAAEEHVAWVLRKLDVNCVLDVGANVGQYARRLRKAGYTGRIVSFEPVSHLADQLEKAAADDPDWQVRRHACGQATEEATINVTSGMGRMSSLLPPSEFGKSWSARLTVSDAETVSVRRLDEVFDDATAGIAEPRVFLKLDTQGYDLQAFAGAGDRIHDVLGMQSEVSSLPIYENMPRLTDQIATYEAAGFHLTGMFPVSIDKPTLRVIEFDAVMVRAEAVSAGEDPVGRTAG